MWQDKEPLQLGDLMRQQKLTGKVVSNANYSIMRKFAFKSGSQYYESTAQNYFSPELPALIKKSQLDYYYMFYQDENNLNFLKQSVLYKAAYKQFYFPLHHLVVLRMKPVER